MSTFTVVTKAPIPATLPPQAVISALHAYRPLIESNPHLVSYERRSVGVEEVVQDPFFREDGAHLQAFTCYQRITIIPGVGSWATKDVSVPCVFQSLPQGVRCRADAGSGVMVWSAYEVRPRGEVNGSDHDPPPAPGDGDFELVEIAIVECSAFVRPFVRRSLSTSHQEILEVLVQRVAKGYGRESSTPSPAPGNGGGYGKETVVPRQSYSSHGQAPGTAQSGNYAGHGTDAQRFNNQPHGQEAPVATNPPGPNYI
ncbi:hypothetical protein OQA88_10844 [Cercophora sp. LCS_1]